MNYITRHWMTWKCSIGFQSKLPCSLGVIYGMGGSDLINIIGNWVINQQTRLERTMTSNGKGHKQVKGWQLFLPSALGFVQILDFHTIRMPMYFGLSNLGKLSDSTKQGNWFPLVRNLIDFQLHFTFFNVPHIHYTQCSTYATYCILRF